MKKGIVASILCLLVVAMMVPGFVKPTIAAEKEKVVVDFLGAQYGRYSFIMLYAASDLVNKHHPTIKGLVHETFGARDCVLRLDADQKLRKHAIATCTIPALYAARAGKPKKIYPRPIKGILNLWNELDGAYTLGTTDPNIRTPADFVGKRVDVGAYGNFTGAIGDYVLEAYGVTDKVASLEHNASQKAACSNLVDGKIDVAFLGGSKLGEKEIGWPSGSREVLAARKCYPVSYSKEMVMKIAELSGIPFAPWELPAGAFSKDARSFTTMYYPLNAVAHEDMPEELVYEVMKVLIANADKFRNYSKLASWLTKENMAAMHVPVEDFHPGAIRAYREAGIKIGEEYFR